MDKKLEFRKVDTNTEYGTGYADGYYVAVQYTLIDVADAIVKKADNAASSSVSSVLRLLAEEVRAGQHDIASTTTCETLMHLAAELKAHHHEGPVRFRMTMDEFQARWAKECAEWQLIAHGSKPGITSAYDVTQEQRRRMRERGEEPMNLRLIVIPCTMSNGDIIDMPVLEEE